MFTGLVERMGQVCEVLDRPPGKRFILRAGELMQGVAIGDSIAINGCCLTVIWITDDQLGFDAGEETLSRTNLGRLQPGDAVNLERSIRADDRLGGHLVTGHIDGVGHLRDRRDDADWSFVWFHCPRQLTRQVASKGSIAVDGVSLTVVDVGDDWFSVALIPHTLQVTTLGRLHQNDTVNLETDLLAKYVERQLLFLQTPKSTEVLS